MTNLSEPKLQQLLRECSAGNRKSQQTLYQHFSPVIYAICVRYMGATDEAKDMLQETMVKFFQKSAEFRFQGSLEGWVKRIAVNTCLDQIKKNKAKYAGSLEEAYDLAGDVNAAQPLETKDLMKLLPALARVFCVTGISIVKPSVKSSLAIKAQRKILNQLFTLVYASSSLR